MNWRHSFIACPFARPTHQRVSFFRFSWKANIQRSCCFKGGGRIGGHRVRCSVLLDQIVDHQRATKLGKPSLREFAEIDSGESQPLDQRRDIGIGRGIVA